MGRNILRLSTLAIVAVFAFGACRRVEEAPPPAPKGPLAPEIAIKEFLNAPVNMPTTLEGLRGRVILLEYWATWCVPCLASVPHVRELYDKFSSRGLQVISITDEDREIAKPFVEKNKMSYVIGLGGKETRRAYGVKAIPMAFLIGRDGRILWQGKPIELKDAQIEDALQSVEKK